MATIEGIYLGELRTEAIHVRSGNHLVTDAPIDNHGKGEAFSPTDLLATSLGSCMLTIMGILGNAHNINVDGTKCSVTKIMAENPRRVAEIQTKFEFVREYSKKEQKMLEHAVLTCPVYLSIHPDLKKTVDFGW